MLSPKPPNFSINNKWVNEIPDDIIEGFNSAEPPVIFIGSGFGKEAIPPLKTGGELIALLQDELGLEGNGESLAELLQYRKNNMAGNKRSVVDWLKKQLLHGTSKPGGAYRLLLELPSKLFLTTNYDSLLSDASRQFDYNLVAVDDPSSLGSTYNDMKSIPRSGVLGRLHGAFEYQDKMIATTDDYIERYTSKDNRWQELLEEIFRTRRIIFIGYSLKDFTTWTSFISVFTNWKSAIYPYALVSPARSKYHAPFWERYNTKYISLKAYQFLIAVHDQLGNLEEREEVAIAAAAACSGMSYSDCLIEVEKRKKQFFYSSLTIAALRMIMEGCYDN